MDNLFSQLLTTILDLKTKLNDQPYLADKKTVIEQLNGLERTVTKFSEIIKNGIGSEHLEKLEKEVESVKSHLVELTQKVQNNIAYQGRIAINNLSEEDEGNPKTLVELQKELGDLSQSINAQSSRSEFLKDEGNKVITLNHLKTYINESLKSIETKLSETPNDKDLLRDQSNLQNSQKNLQKFIEKIESTLEGFKGKLEAALDSIGDTTSLKTEVKKIKQQIAGFEKEIQSLETEIAELKDEHTDLLKDAKEFAQLMDPSQSEEMQKLMTKIAEINIKTSALTKTIATKEALLEELEQKKSGAEYALETIQNTRDAKTAKEIISETATKFETFKNEIAQQQDTYILPINQFASEQSGENSKKETTTELTSRSKTQKLIVLISKYEHLKSSRRGILLRTTRLHTGTIDFSSETVRTTVAGKLKKPAEELGIQLNASGAPIDISKKQYFQVLQKTAESINEDFKNWLQKVEEFNKSDVETTLEDYRGILDPKGKWETFYKKEYQKACTLLSKSAETLTEGFRLLDTTQYSKGGKIYNLHFSDSDGEVFFEIVDDFNKLLKLTRSIKKKTSHLECENTVFTDGESRFTFDQDWEPFLNKHNKTWDFGSILLTKEEYFAILETASTYSQEQKDLIKERLSAFHSSDKECRYEDFKQACTKHEIKASLLKESFEYLQSIQDNPEVLDGEFNIINPAQFVEGSELYKRFFAQKSIDGLKEATQTTKVVFLNEDEIPHSEDIVEEDITLINNIIQLDKKTILVQRAWDILVTANKKINEVEGARFSPISQQFYADQLASNPDFNGQSLDEANLKTLIQSVRTYLGLQIEQGKLLSEAIFEESVTIFHTSPTGQDQTLAESTFTDNQEGLKSLIEPIDHHPFAIEMAQVEGSFRDRLGYAAQARIDWFKSLEKGRSGETEYRLSASDKEYLEGLRGAFASLHINKENKVSIYESTSPSQTKKTQINKDDQIIKIIKDIILKRKEYLQLDKRISNKIKKFNGFSETIEGTTIFGPFDDCWKPVFEELNMPKAKLNHQFAEFTAEELRNLVSTASKRRDTLEQEISSLIEEFEKLSTQQNVTAINYKDDLESFIKKANEKLAKKFKTEHLQDLTQSWKDTNYFVTKQDASNLKENLFPQNVTSESDTQSLVKDDATLEQIKTLLVKRKAFLQLVRRINTKIPKYFQYKETEGKVSFGTFDGVWSDIFDDIQFDRKRIANPAAIFTPAELYTILKKACEVRDSLFEDCSAIAKDLKERNVKVSLYADELKKVLKNTNDGLQSKIKVENLDRLPTDWNHSHSHANHFMYIEYNTASQEESATKQQDLVEKFSQLLAVRDEIISKHIAFEDLLNNLESYKDYVNDELAGYKLPYNEVFSEIYEAVGLEAKEQILTPAQMFNFIQEVCLNNHYNMMLQDGLVHEIHGNKKHVTDEITKALFKESQNSLVPNMSMYQRRHIEGGASINPPVETTFNSIDIIQNVFDPIIEYSFKSHYGQKIKDYQEGQTYYRKVFDTLPENYVTKAESGRIYTYINDTNAPIPSDKVKDFEKLPDQEKLLAQGYLNLIRLRCINAALKINFDTLFGKLDSYRSIDESGHVTFKIPYNKGLKPLYEILNLKEEDKTFTQDELYKLVMTYGHMQSDIHTVSHRIIHRINLNKRFDTYEVYSIYKEEISAEKPHGLWHLSNLEDLIQNTAEVNNLVSRFAINHPTEVLTGSGFYNRIYDDVEQSTDTQSTNLHYLDSGDLTPPAEQSVVNHNELRENALLKRINNLVELQLQIIQKSKDIQKYFYDLDIAATRRPHYWNEEEKRTEHNSNRAIRFRNVYSDAFHEDIRGLMTEIDFDGKSFNDRELLTRNALLSIARHVFSQQNDAVLEYESLLNELAEFSDYFTTDFNNIARAELQKHPQAEKINAEFGDKYIDNLLSGKDAFVSKHTPDLEYTKPAGQYEKKVGDVNDKHIIHFKDDIFIEYPTSFSEGNGKKVEILETLIAICLTYFEYQDLSDDIIKKRETLGNLKKHNKNLFIESDDPVISGKKISDLMKDLARIAVALNGKIDRLQDLQSKLPSNSDIYHHIDVLKAMEVVRNGSTFNITHAAYNAHEKVDRTAYQSGGEFYEHIFAKPVIKEKAKQPRTPQTQQSPIRKEKTISAYDQEKIKEAQDKAKIKNALNKILEAEGTKTDKLKKLFEAREDYRSVMTLVIADTLKDVINTFITEHSLAEDWTPMGVQEIVKLPELNTENLTISKKELASTYNTLTRFCNQGYIDLTSKASIDDLKKMSDLTKTALEAIGNQLSNSENIKADSRMFIIGQLQEKQVFLESFSNELNDLVEKIPTDSNLEISKFDIEIEPIVKPEDLKSLPKAPQRFHTVLMDIKRKQALLKHYEENINTLSDAEYRNYERISEALNSSYNQLKEEMERADGALRKLNNLIGELCEKLYEGDTSDDYNVEMEIETITKEAAELLCNEFKIADSIALRQNDGASSEKKHHRFASKQLRNIYQKYYLDNNIQYSENPVEEFYEIFKDELITHLADRRNEENLYGGMLNEQFADYFNLQKSGKASTSTQDRMEKASAEYAAYEKMLQEAEKLNMNEGQQTNVRSSLLATRSQSMQSLPQAQLSKWQVSNINQGQIRFRAQNSGHVQMGSQVMSHHAKAAGAERFGSNARQVGTINRINRFSAASQRLNQNVANHQWSNFNMTPQETALMRTIVVSQALYHGGRAAGLNEHQLKTLNEVGVLVLHPAFMGAQFRSDLIKQAQRSGITLASKQMNVLQGRNLVSQAQSIMNGLSRTTHKNVIKLKDGLSLVKGMSQGKPYIAVMKKLTPIGVGLYVGGKMLFVPKSQ